MTLRFAIRLVACLCAVAALQAAPAFAGCPLSTSGMSVRLTLDGTSTEVSCVDPGTAYDLEIFGPSSNNYYCIVPQAGTGSEPRQPVGFTTTSECKDATYGDIAKPWQFNITTDATLPPGGIEGGASPGGCTGEDLTLEYAFSYPSCSGGTTCTPPPADLRAWFPLDETSGTTVRDRVANLAGTAYGALIGPCKVANCRAFSASGSSYVSVPDHSNLDVGTGDFTIDAWIKTTKADGIIVAKRSSANIGYLFMVYDGRLLLQMGDAGGYRNFVDFGTARIDDGQWHFVAVSVDRDSSSGGRMYVDGNLVYTFDPRGYQGSLANSEPLLMAKTGQNDPYAYYQGQIDEVELFARALPESELDAIWAAGSAGKCKSCGNGLCESGESCSTCPGDCGSCSWCGNGLCESGETCSTCASDCGPCPRFCDNDGICEVGEDPDFCADCCGGPIACP